MMKILCFKSIVLSRCLSTIFILHLNLFQLLFVSRSIVGLKKWFLCGKSGSNYLRLNYHIAIPNDTKFQSLVLLLVPFKTTIKTLSFNPLMMTFLNLKFLFGIIINISFVNHQLNFAIQLLYLYLLHLLQMTYLFISLLFIRFFLPR